MLLRENGLVGFDVGAPSETGTPGKGGFAKHLDAVLSGDAKDKIKTLLVVADNEDDPAASLKECQVALKKVANYDVPDPPNILRSDRVVAIHMLPSPATAGALEHLLLDALFDVYPGLKKCVQQFSQSTKRSLTWTSNRKAKMYLQALISSHCEDNPCLQTTLLWTNQNWKRSANPFPRSNPRYKPLIDFLKSFTEIGARV